MVNVLTDYMQKPFFLIKIVTAYNLFATQGFIQALLLTSVFHERLSFMAVCHNFKFVNMMTLAAGGGGGGAYGGL